MTEQEGTIRDSVLDCEIGDIVPCMYWNDSFEVTVPDAYHPLPHQLVTWGTSRPRPTVYKFRLHPQGVIRYA
jgi:hypothetical protein